MKQVTIYWTCNRTAKKRIQQRFGFSEHVGVNGESVEHVKNEDWQLFTDTMQRGFFKVRTK